MQRFSLWLLIIATLYVSACSTTTRQQPPVSPTTATPVTTAPAAPAPAPVEPVTSAAPSATLETSPLQPGMPALPPAENPAPHIAIILPLKSPSFATSADAVLQGFLAAAKVQPRDFPVRAYASAGDGKDTLDVYRQAQANGAVAVAGPLTRYGVAQLAGYPFITVPTLALNAAEQKPVSNKLFFFSLLPETEARQMAQFAFANKLQNATIINTGTTIAKRMALAFADEWKKLGGEINAEVNFKEGDDTSVLTNLPVAPWLVEPTPPPTITTVSELGEVSFTAPKRTGPPPIAPGNVAFLAADNRMARLIRPYLNPTLPVYGTSLLFDPRADTLTNYDLNDIRFADMPWLLQPDHAAVMIYPRTANPLDNDKERLYAFGIDAYRLLNNLLHARRLNVPLDGVTGRIRLDEASSTFQREAQTALFKYGRGLTPDTLAAAEAERAAARAAEIAARKAANESNSAPAAQ